MMDSTLKMTSSIVSPVSSFYSTKLNHISNNKISYEFQSSACRSTGRISATASANGAVPHNAVKEAQSSPVGDTQRQRSSLESLFCYDKPVPEERIEEPVGLAMAKKQSEIMPGALIARLKVQSFAPLVRFRLICGFNIREPGVIVKVRCLGCGGSGNIMCAKCGGRGHRGPK